MTKRGLLARETILRVENGSDLRNRVLVLEQRATTLAESLQELVQIVRGITGELTYALGTLNAELVTGRAPGALTEIDARLTRLDYAIRKLPKS